DAAGGPVGAFGVRVALKIAIVARVGINDAAYGAMLPGHARLDAAEARAVTRNDDPAANIDSALFEDVVIGGESVVYVNQRRGDIAAAGVRVIRRDGRG